MRPSPPLDPMTATPPILCRNGCRGLAFGPVGSGRQLRSSALHEGHRGARPPNSSLLAIPASTQTKLVGPHRGVTFPAADQRACGVVRRNPALGMTLAHLISA